MPLARCDRPSRCPTPQTPQGGGQHLQLAASLVQAMFPPISVQTVKLSACQVRVFVGEGEGCRGRAGSRRSGHLLQW